MSTPAITLESDLRSTLRRFGTRWDAMPISATQRADETVLMDFAKHKLLDGLHELANDDRPSLACLSVRFALEFCIGGTARNVAYAHAELHVTFDLPGGCHMRFNVAAATGFEKLVTPAGSEPLLAEAAYDLIEGTQMNAVHV